MPTRPFSVIGVQQIAIGARDKSALLFLWVELLGLEKLGQFRSESENVSEDILRIGSGSGQVELDLMEPLDPNRRPRVHEPALNHIGLWVDDLEAAVAWLSARGVRFAPGGLRRGAAGHLVTFIHPKGDEQSPLSGEGVLIELVQAPAGMLVASRPPRAAQP